MGQENDEYTRNVVNGIDEIGERDDIVTLSSGVKIRVKEVPQHFIFAVTSKFKKPRPPWVEVGGMQKENADDPDYQQDLTLWIANLTNAGTDVALTLGTEIEEVPSGIPKETSKEFKEMMEFFDMPMRDNKTARKLNWIKAIAAPTFTDIELLIEGIGRLTGTLEVDVAQAVEMFRNLTIRETDSES